jgi:hypothetical protein
MSDTQDDTVECTKCSRRYDPRTTCAERGCPMYPFVMQQRTRTVDAKIARLRARLKDTMNSYDLRGVLLGILDLLGDEL